MEKQQLNPPSLVQIIISFHCNIFNGIKAVSSKQFSYLCDLLLIHVGTRMESRPGFQGFDGQGGKALPCHFLVFKCVNVALGDTGHGSSEGMVALHGLRGLFQP